MNKAIIRIIAIVLILSVWVYVSSTYKDVLYIALGVIMLLATLDISKKKKQTVVEIDTENRPDSAQVNRNVTM